MHLHWVHGNYLNCTFDPNKLYGNRKSCRCKQTFAVRLEFCDTWYTAALTDRTVTLPGSKEPSCFLETNLREKVISDRNCYLMASF